jgi:hypothetical protein
VAAPVRDGIGPQALKSTLPDGDSSIATIGGDAQVRDKGSRGEPPAAVLAGSRSHGPVAAFVPDRTLLTSDGPAARVRLPEPDQRAKVEEQHNALIGDYVFRLLFSSAQASQNSEASNLKLAPIPSLLAATEEQSSIEYAIEAGRAASIALTVGAVWWALRAGGLMASAAVSAPLWRNFDPLPIIADDEDEGEDDWGEPLDEIAAREERAAADVFAARHPHGTEI